MNRNRIGIAILLPVLALATAWGQDAAKQAVQAKLAAIRQSIAQNQASLKAYTWTETVEMSIKGEVKKRNQSECRYGPNGKVQKTPIGAPDEGGSKGGLKGKMVAKKVDELKDYMDRVGSLISRYVPPDPQNMKAAFQAGKAGLDKAMLSRMGRLNRMFSCKTTPIWWRSEAVSIMAMSCPSTSTLPRSGT